MAELTDLKKQTNADDESDIDFDLQNEVIDDEDAIDRLLMDNAFDNPSDDEEDEFAEIDEIIGENLDETANPQSESDEDYDEFGDDDLSTSIGVDANTSNFDISCDEPDSETIAQDSTSPTELSRPSHTPSADYSDKFASIDQLINKLTQSQDQLSQKIRAVEANSNHDSPGGSANLTALQSEQKKITRQISALESKKPIMAGAAMGIAIIGTLLAIGFMVKSFMSDSALDQTHNRLIELEERVDAWISKNNHNDETIKLSRRLNELEAEFTNITRLTSNLQTSLSEQIGQQNSTSHNKQVETLIDQQMQMADAFEELQLKVLNLEKNKGAVSVKNTKQKWVVNLVSFKQEWYAKRKAQEFEAQGIPVDVNTTAINGEKWFRLRVKGFKSKYEAAAYAAKVKKSLNLTSVWLTEE